MLAFLPLFVLGTRNPDPLAWVGELLRRAPATPPSEFPRVETPVEPTLPPGVPQTVLPFDGPDRYDRHRPRFDPAERDAECRAEKRHAEWVTRLIASGRYEEAYRIEDAHRQSDDDFVGGWFVDASLLTGRFNELETRLVGFLRRHPDVEGHRANSVSTYVQLSVASAMRGRVYAGQGRYVLDALREGLRWDVEYEAYRAEIATPGQPVPTEPQEVALVGVLALAETSVWDDAYWEWALRLAPGRALAGEKLANHYRLRNRDADVIRVCTIMVRSLRAGSRRDGFARRLAEAQRRLKAQASKPVQATP